MRADQINPFITSLLETFQTMLNCELVRGQPYLRQEPDGSFAVSGVIGLSGDAIGAVVVGFTKEAALQAASALLMSEATELNTDVKDAIGEIANMVAGAAKAKLEGLRLAISLPNVVTGPAHEIHFPSDIRPIVIPFESPWGSLRLEVGLKLVSAGLQQAAASAT